MIRAQAAELAPMTAAWSAGRPGPPVVGRERRADLVPPDLRIDQDAIEIEDDARDRGHVPFEADRRDVDAAAGDSWPHGLGRVLAADAVASPWRRRLARAVAADAVPPAAAGRAPLPVAERPGPMAARRGGVPGVAGAGRPSTAAKSTWAKPAMASAVASAPLRTWVSTWKLIRRWPPWISSPSSPSCTRFQRTTLPLARGPSPGDVDPDVELDQAARRRREDHVADARVVAPDHPAVRIARRAEHAERRIDDRLDLGRDRILDGARSRHSLSRIRASRPSA